MWSGPLLAAGALIAACFAAGQSSDSHPATAAQWVERMVAATRTLNFHGSFVYFDGSGISSARVVHQVAEGGVEVQRVYSLNGTQREVIRHDRKTTLVLPDGSKLTFADQFRSSLFALAITDNVDRLNESYRLVLRSEDRVADRRCQGISIVPVDEYRYGYDLWLDQETAVLMRADLIGHGNKRLEQLMFTEIHIGERTADSDAAEAPDAATNEPPIESGPESLQSQAERDWWLEGGPPHFEEVYYGSDAGEHDGFTDHLVLSDGLATVSVHVQPLVEDQEPVSGLSKMGAVSAYAGTADGYQFYVVGEVPPATVKAVAKALRGPGDAR